MKKRISDKYVALVSKDKVAKRIWFLKRVAEITEKAALPIGMEIRLCGIRLTNAVYSYFYEKERSKDFHGHDEEPNNQKKLAWMVKWVSKIKPFSVHFDPAASITQQQKYHYQNLINPIFCIVLFRVLLQKDPNVCFGDTLLYELHYGNATSNMLTVLFERP